MERERGGNYLGERERGPPPPPRGHVGPHSPHAVAPPSRGEERPEGAHVSGLPSHGGGTGGERAGDYNISLGPQRPPPPPPPPRREGGTGSEGGDSLMGAYERTGSDISGVDSDVFSRRATAGSSVAPSLAHSVIRSDVGSIVSPTTGSIDEAMQYYPPPPPPSAPQNMSSSYQPHSPPLQPVSYAAATNGGDLEPSTRAQMLGGVSTQGGHPPPPPPPPPPPMGSSSGHQQIPHRGQPPPPPPPHHHAASPQHPTRILKRPEPPRLVNHPQALAPGVVGPLGNLTGGGLVPPTAALQSLSLDHPTAGAAGGSLPTLFGNLDQQQIQQQAQHAQQQQAQQQPLMSMGGAPDGGTTALGLPQHSAFNPAMQGISLQIGNSFTNTQGPPGLFAPPQPLATFGAPPTGTAPGSNTATGGLRDLNFGLPSQIPSPLQQPGPPKYQFGDYMLPDAIDGSVEPDTATPRLQRGQGQGHPTTVLPDNLGAQFGGVSGMDPHSHSSGDKNHPGDRMGGPSGGRGGGGRGGHGTQHGDGGRREMKSGGRGGGGG